MTVKTLYINSIGNVTFTQNTRSRTIRLRVKPDQSVHVTYPRYVTLTEAVRFAEQHTEWVERQKKRMTSRIRLFHEEVPFTTRTFTLRFRKHPGNFRLKQTKNEIDFLYPENLDLNGPEVTTRIGRVITGLFRLEATAYLPGRLRILAEKHGFRYNGLTIRNNKSNWGSCSGKNNISLNLHLMKMPDHLIDLILLHELVHTRIKNHGPEFWKMLDSVAGGQARQMTREVKKYSPG